MLFHGHWSGIIGGQSQTPAAKAVKHHLQITRAAVQIFMRICGVDPQLGCRSRHQLCQPGRPGVGNRTGIPTGFLLHQTQEQILRHAMFARGGLGHLKILALVIALVTRGGGDRLFAHTLFRGVGFQPFGKVVLLGQLAIQQGRLRFEQRRAVLF